MVKLLTWSLPELDWCADAAAGAVAPPPLLLPASLVRPPCCACMSLNMGLFLPCMFLLALTRSFLVLSSALAKLLTSELVSCVRRVGSGPRRVPREVRAPLSRHFVTLQPCVCGQAGEPDAVAAAHLDLVLAELALEHVGVEGRHLLHALLHHRLHLLQRGRQHALKVEVVDWAREPETRRRAAKSSECCTDHGRGEDAEALERRALPQRRVEVPVLQPPRVAGGGAAARALGGLRPGLPLTVTGDALLARRRAVAGRSNPATTIEGPGQGAPCVVARLGTRPRAPKHASLNTSSHEFSLCRSTADGADTSGSASGSMDAVARRAASCGCGSGVALADSATTLAAARLASSRRLSAFHWARACAGDSAKQNNSSGAASPCRMRKRSAAAEWRRSLPAR